MSCLIIIGSDIAEGDTISVDLNETKDKIVARIVKQPVVSTETPELPELPAETKE